LHTLILTWQKAGIRVIELAQNAGRVESDQALYDAVISKSIRHYNDPTLNEHVRNAVAIETLRGFRLAKEKTSRKIDAAVALSMSHYGALGMGKMFIHINPATMSNYIRDTDTLSLDDLLHPHGAIYSNPQYIQFANIRIQKQ
jgi:phage terminase large subunit-like protein